MKYCIITNEKKITNEEFESVGFFQWVNVLNGEIFLAQDLLPNLKDGDYDIIHIRLTSKNIVLISKLRDKIGKNSITKIVATLDLPVKFWKSEFTSIRFLCSAVNNADFVFTTEYSISLRLETLIKKTVYELPHPVDIHKLKKIKKAKIDNLITLLFCENYNELIWLDKQIKKSIGYNTRILFYKNNNKKIINKFQNKNIEVIDCNDEEDFCKRLIESEFVIAPYNQRDYGKNIIYPSILGVPVIGTDKTDVQRRCYPFIINSTGRKSIYLEIIKWLMEHGEGKHFMIQNAQTKVEYYNWENLKKKFMDLLFYKTKDLRFKYKRNNVIKRNHSINFYNKIVHLYGKKEVKLNKNNFAVVCLVKDGQEYMDNYVNHYIALGAEHIFIIDNGSSDRTISRLKKFNNVTIYQTNLEHNKYECEIRRAIIEEHCMGSWCLYADADEIFDFPYSNIITMKQFINYLNINRYTSIIAYMLDMFPKTLNFATKNNPENLIEEYCYYDISNIKKKKYFSYRLGLYNYNKLSDKKMKYYYGGIRDQYFNIENIEYLLIKHPFMFINGKLDVLTDPHYCNKSFIADVSCVLKHFKITNRLKEKVLSNKNNYAYFGNLQNKAYQKVLNDNNNFQLYSEKSNKLKCINDLIKNKYISVSKKYKRYIKNQKDLIFNE